MVALPRIFLLIALMLYGFWGCAGAVAPNDLDTDPDTAVFMLVLIRDVYGFPCGSIKEIRAAYTPTGDHYNRVLCITLPGHTRYTVQFNPFAPRGTTRSWIVRQAFS